MKTNRFILGLFILSSLSIYADTEKVIKSKVDHVTVFLQGAQVYRSSAVNLSAGTTKIIFDNLEAGIDPKSLQASGNGNFIILDVEQLTKYPEPQTIKIDPNASPKNLKLIKAISDSIQSVDFDLEDLGNKKQVLETEKSTLLSNRLMKGEFKKDSLAIVKDALDYLRAHLNNINSEMLKLKREDVKLQSIKTGMKERLQAQQNFNSNPGQTQAASTNPSYQVVVTVSSDAVATGSVELNYLLASAGWTPSYDLRAKDSNTAMQLTYKANVFQNTGLSWDNVKLKLSTGNPNQSNIKPILTAWYLDYYTNYSNRRYNRQAMGLPKAAGEALGAVADESKVLEKDKEDAAQSAANFTTFIETATNFEFDIKLAYSIPSDGVTHLVSVKNEEVPANFMHYAVPKLDRDAFLVARVTGWEDLNLMPGKANIFFDGTFVGESFIDPANTNDTLNLTLGRDKSVVVTRNKLKDKTKEKILNSDKLQTITYEITVKNTKSTSMEMMLEDQIPVSANKNIVVEAIDLAGAGYDKETGLLEWKLDLKPKESKKILVTYSVKFSKDKTLSAGLM